MTGYGSFLRKEFAEIVRTWRLPVLALVLLANALLSVAAAKYTKELLASLAPGTDVMALVPDPVHTDAWLQWLKNLSQIGLLAILIGFGGIIAGEVRSGTAMLVLTKPVSRTAFVLAKFTALVTLVVTCVVVTSAVVGGLTALLFPDVSLRGLVASVALWLVFAVFMLAVLLLASAALDQGTAAGGVAVGAYLLTTIATLWGPAARHSLAGLTDIAGKAALGTEVDVLWPVVTALVGTVLLVAAAVLVFRRREL